MDPELQQLEDLISQSAKMTEQNKVQITSQINYICSSPSSIFLFYRLILHSSNATVCQGASLYLSQTFAMHFAELGDQDKMQCKDFSIQVINSVQSPLILHTFEQIVVLVYEKTGYEWPEIFQTLASLISDPEKASFALSVLSLIVLGLPKEKLQQQIPYLQSIIESAIQSATMPTVIGAVSLFSTLVTSSDTEISLPDVLEKICSIRPSSLSASLYTSLWNSIAILNNSKAFTEDQTHAICMSAISAASDSTADCKLRMSPLEALLPILPILPEFTPTILSLTLSICAQVIEEDKIMPNDFLSHFETAIHVFPHEEIYSLIQSLISQAFQSGLLQEQTAALLIFRVIFVNAQECAYRDIEQITSFLTTSLQSENILLQEAACSVIEVFDDSFQATNIYSPRFLPFIIPLFVSENPDLRQHSYAAALALLPTIDTRIDGILNSVITLAERVNEDDWSKYLAVLASSVEIEENFDDQSCDFILGLIGKLIGSKNAEKMAACLQVGIALIHVDESQSESIAPMLISAAIECMRPPNEKSSSAESSIEPSSKYIQFECLSFFGNLAAALGDEDKECLSDIAKIITEALNQIKSEYVMSAAIEAAAKVARYQPNPQLACDLIPAIVKGLESPKPLLETASALAVRILKKQLTADDQKQLFDDIANIIYESIDEDLVGDAFLSLSKIIKYLKPENKEEILMKSLELVGKMNECQLPIEAWKPLLECGSFQRISQPVAHFLASILRYPTSASDDICIYLLQWLQKNPDVQDYDVTGAFINAFESGTISGEVQSKILEAIDECIKIVSDPSLQQNLVYFLNIAVKTNPQLLPLVENLLPEIEKWRVIGKDARFGYQDLLANIASLYLEVACHNNEIPQEYILAAIEEFPPYDALECVPMANSIMKIIHSDSSNILKSAVAFAIARFAVWDQTNLTKGKVTKELSEQMFAILRGLVAEDGSLKRKIAEAFPKSKSKSGKINNILK